ncbi:glioma pathogenesis-related protein 1 isoform X2 [Anolis carolinensis]|uniref:glioma pathogenesis-related protein 1 isoform X2 n=1 Tax=Anolis carolinensis TaxID=28377 RepID=UPI002F2B2682
MGMGMGRACAWFLLGLFASAITLGASQMFAPYPDINNKTFIKLYVDAHNKFRSEVKPSAANMLYMVVWASSYKVGCAVAFCHKVFKGGENMGMLVCDYGPAGNYKGTRPYKAGKPCDECQAKDTCQNNLCRNRKRDQENTSYIHWYPPSYSCCGFKDFVNVYSICSCVFLKILLSWIKF